MDGWMINGVVLSLVSAKYNKCFDFFIVQEEGNATNIYYTVRRRFNDFMLRYLFSPLVSPHIISLH